MTLLKAKMAFFHDAVGNKANNELFEVQNQEVAQELENLGYVQQADSNEQELFAQNQQLQQEVGKRNAMTNEAVSIANHVHNVNANQTSQEIASIRQSVRQQQVKQAEQKHQEQKGNTQAQANEAVQGKTTVQVKKADK